MYLLIPWRYALWLPCSFCICERPELSSGEGKGTPLQYSCLENPMDGGAWWAAVHRVAKSQTRLSDFTFTFHFHVLEKEMATHSSVLAWRIPGIGEPGGLLSTGSHRVGHNWSNLAAELSFAVPERGAREERRSPGWKIRRPGQRPWFVSWPGFLLPVHRCKPWGKPPRFSGGEKGEASPGSWCSQKAVFGAPSTHSLLLTHPYLRIGRESRKGKTSGRNT